MIIKKELLLMAICLSIFTNVIIAQEKPNIVIIYADDLGYGDISSYGAPKIATPNIDILASKGIRFTRAYASSATCTPSRFSMLTGKYAWRKSDTGIAAGDAALTIPTSMTTMPGMLQKAGYKTAVVGKWHLGLGLAGGPDWNADIKPGPLEIGFDYCFMLPSTGDRVPSVYMENYRIVGLDPSDPIYTSYKNKIGNEPTGMENPELLKIKADPQHSQTIVNGVSRIGFMTGGKSARWIDEDMADVLTDRAIRFIDKSKAKPFFLYFSTHDIHVPRMPHSRFAGKSGMGPRGDAILQLDWTVGRLTKALDDMNLSSKTIVIFSSDNGPVLNDGYSDDAEAKLNGHTPNGPLRGGKYSAFEAGTRIPLILSWPGKVKPGIVSNAVISQLDFYASFADLTGQILRNGDEPDSFNSLSTLLGKNFDNREYVVQHALNGTLSLVKGDWKYIEPSSGPKVIGLKNIESGFSNSGQLYNLKNDPTELKNVAQAKPEIFDEMRSFLTKVKESIQTRR